jgi:hypothetical protein
MPKIICKCGEILSCSQIPSNIEYKFMSDVEFDSYTGTIDVENLYDRMKSFIQCSNCSRLWIFWNGYNNNPTEYTKN